MPKTATADFQRVWGHNRNRKGVFKVELKKRYWNGSAYVLESSATVLYPKDVVSFNPISWKLDVPIKTKILASNASIVFHNPDHKWNPENISSGVWAPTQSVTAGFVPYKSQMVIYYGYELSDGTNEYLAIFTGRVSKITTNSAEPIARIELIGNEVLLEDADAQRVVNTFTNTATNPATGDGSNLTFDTQKQSLWDVSQVRVNGTAKTQGTHYTLTNVDDAETTCKIVFTAGNAPPAGQAVDFNGQQWKRNSSVSTLLGLLCDEAGIGSGNRIIEEPLWPAAGQSQNEDTGADWNASTAATNIDDDTFLGFILPKWKNIDDFSDGDYTASPAWTVVHDVGNVTVVSNRLKFALPGGANVTTFFLPYSISTGTWVLNVEHAVNTNATLFYIVDSSSNSGFAPTGNGYAVQVLGGANEIKILKVTAGSTSVLATGSCTTGTREIRLTRDSSGLLQAYVDGVLACSATDTTYINFSYIAIYATGTTTNPSYVDTISHSSAIDGSGTVDTSTSVHESKEFDLGAAPTAWGVLEYIQTLNDGTVTYATNVASVSGGPYDGWTALGTGNVIASNLKRYIKVRVTITHVKGSYTTANVDKVVINYFSTTLLIQSANFKGLTCFQAVQEFAKQSNCVFGFEGNGDFFFKNRKTTGSVDFTLDQDDVVQKIVSLDAGWQNIANVGQVSYGSGDSTYYSEYGATESGEASPTSEETYGVRPRRLTVDRFIFANDAQVGDSMAQKIYDDDYLPKLNVKAECRIIPQLNLLDLLYVSFYDTPLKQNVVFGDPFQSGLTSPEPKNVVLPKTLFAAVAAQFDISKSKVVLDLEEILS